VIDEDAVGFEEDDYEDPEFSSDWELAEVQRLIQLVQDSAPKQASPTLLLTNTLQQHKNNRHREPKQQHPLQTRMPYKKPSEGGRNFSRILKLLIDCWRKET
jgi:hypothetical protein